ncbi:MAG: TM0106 family RecB-like putative nuclease [Allosphingosinicella sp.]|uniref:TM0106 family RecB-like putative nuclease n=1 Tax=Allosphingosinicella sp. TaxID=2823234 RepID=UPI0039633804
MRYHNDSLLHSASDLNAFLGCAHAAALNLRKLVNPESLPERAEDDDTVQLVQAAGHEHEASYLSVLKEQGKDVAEISSRGSLEVRRGATIEAMRDGRQIIYQATFLDAPWHGFADFLRRVDTPSKLGPWSYEPIDTKLARSADPKHVLQLGIYADLISEAQGALPHSMHLVLGDGREESFRRVEFQHTLATAKARYLEFIASGAEGSVGEPCAACTYCGWREHCSSVWEADDHLSLVAGITRGQIEKLRAAGIDSVAALAKMPAGSRVPKLSPETFERLRAQAFLQVERRAGEPAVELLPLQENRGFLRLPAPDAADLFFDLEGDPLYPGGLEYLWGIHYRDQGQPRFIAEWAHDREAERTAFERIVDFLTAHVRRHPNAHIYHYAAYEITALRRLSTTFASREEAVDNLLRAEKFVDLYSIGRNAVRTSESSLSLKALEAFFAAKRDDAVTKADQSIVFYHRWRETGEQAFLDDILAYNKVDCENTEGLRDWLIGLRPTDLAWWSRSDAVPTEPSEEESAAEKRREWLRQLLREQAEKLSPRGRELFAHLIDFHRRAQKPDQWAVFDRCDRMEDELIDDGECIGDIRPAGQDWLRPEKRSTIATYAFPPQDTKLQVGKGVLHAPSRQSLGTIHGLNCEEGWVEVKRGAKAGPEWPESGSIIPTWPLSTGVLEAAVFRVGEFLATRANEVTRQIDALGAPAGDSPRYQAIVDLIERAPPRLTDWDAGNLVRDGESLIEAATQRALALDRSSLFIQGPPGTGKTYTSAHVIVALLKAGKRVGVSSNSHKAINNLLAKIEEVAGKEGVEFSGAKKVTRSDSDSYLQGGLIQDVDKANDILEGGYRLVGGTAWLFGMAEFDQHFDYLFIDEAGQVSLGHLVAMGAAAKNIILVGDQMQLGQPIKGAHPGESGLSVLDYLLQGAATIAPDRGILLDTSWRMHPSICGFISRAVYDERLHAHPANEGQSLLLSPDAHSALAPSGIRIVDMRHSGCGQRSDEEVELTAELVRSLLGQRFVDRDGREGALTLKNILVVAPYNMQVNALKAALPEGTRVGTVDKFQGQEAEVVIVSLATSTPADLPRHVDFFYSKNRLNVAISRARTVAIVLANPKLLELEAKAVEHLRLVNTLAWLRAEAGGGIHA